MYNIILSVDTVCDYIWLATQVPPYLRPRLATDLQKSLHQLGDVQRSAAIGIYDPGKIMKKISNIPVKNSIFDSSWKKIYWETIWNQQFEDDSIILGM